MRQFLKFFFAAMLGTMAAGVLLVFILFGVGAIVGAAQGKPTAVGKNSVLHLTFKGPLGDRGSGDPFDFESGPFASGQRTGLNDVLASLEHAKTDDRVKGIFLDLGMIDARAATLHQIRRKLVDFKQASGKPIVAYSDGYSQGAYLLATTADAIYLQPKGLLDHTGLNSEYAFLKGLFKKLDIDMQFIRGSNNKFKSFGEVYTEERMSEANRAQVRAIVDGLWGQHLQALSERTGLSVERLFEIAENLEVRKAEDAVRLKLVDGLLFRDQVMEELRQRMDLPAGKDPKLTSLRRYRESFALNKGVDRKAPKLAVIYAEGDIVPGQDQPGSIGGDDLAQTIREAREDSSIKAIVLRVNSPGGSGQASDVIWREVKLATEVKPVVVSMGDVAASGGYYIAAPATRIMAEATTITGSIGVFGIIPNMQGFFNNKLGITFDGVKTNRYADMLTVNRPLKEDELRIMQQWVDDFYDGFRERVAEGRGMTMEAVDEVGQGRVWLGSAALELGLVDELGGLEEAIAAAASLAGLEEHRLVELPRQKPFFERLMEDLKGDALAWVATKLLGQDIELLRHFEAVQRARSASGIMARMPFEPVGY
jgi:protease-4